MADITTGYTWVSGETVTPGKLNQTVNDATISGITNADIDANASISLSKLNLGSGITSSQIADGAVTGAAGGGKIAASAITGQTVIADPLADTDEFLVHDASASALRKVAYSNIAPTVTAAKLNGVAKDGSGNDLSAGTAPIFGCRAWVNFNAQRNSTDTGASTNGNAVLIRASGNVSSVTKNATGDFTVNFNTAMHDASYAACISIQRGDGAGGVAQSGIFGTSTNAYTSITTSSVRIKTSDGSSNGAVDHPATCVIIFR